MEEKLNKSSEAGNNTLSLIAGYIYVAEGVKTGIFKLYNF